MNSIADFWIHYLYLRRS